MNQISIIEDDKKGCCDKVEVTLVCDDHDHEYQHFEEGQEVEDETSNETKIPKVTLVPDDRDHEFRQ